MIKEVDRLMMATDDMKRGLRSFGNMCPPMSSGHHGLGRGGRARGPQGEPHHLFSDIEDLRRYRSSSNRKPSWIIWPNTWVR